MEPVLQRLGDVTIQRLERPKDPKQDPPSASSNQKEAQKPAEENEDSDELYPTDDESLEDSDEDEHNYNPIIHKTLPPAQPPQNLKRPFPPCGLNLGPEISFKKFKTDEKTTTPSKPTPKPAVNPPQLTPISKNEKPVNTITSATFEDEDEHNLSDDDLSYYDSDLESEGELQDLGSDLGLSLNVGEGVKNTEAKTSASSSHPKKAVDPIIPPPFTAVSKLDGNASLPAAKSTKPPVPPPAKPPLTSSNEDEEEEEEGSNGEDESFFERLVEQAEVPPPTPSTPSVKNESTDEDYDVDIKEKLKEMGEITFASVKKGDKPKNTENPSENEVVITKKSGEEVSLMSKFNMRRNIREVMDDTKLDETTLAAQRQEAERLKRVQEQQRILREYQRQAQQERMQQRVMSLLQGDSFPKPGPSNQTRIGNTVLVKLPNGQTKPMTKVPKPPFDMLKMPRPESPHLRYPHPNQMMGSMGPMGHMGAPRGYPRGAMHNRRNSGVQLPPSLSFSPVSKRGPPLIPTRFPQSDSDSEGEDRKRDAFVKSPKDKRDNQTIEVSSDDDCIVVSESEADQVEEEEHDDPSNSGMHTNDEFNQPDEQGRVLVNVGHAEDEPDVFVAPQIAKIIKPHQIGGVRFLYDNIVESITRFDSSAGFGCILAHSMGLGKTLQIVTFSDVFLRYTPARTILCIMPINTLQNWMAEYNMWTPTAEAVCNSPLNANGEVRPRNFHLLVLNDSHKSLVARQKVIHQWQAQGGVLLIGYEQFRLLSMKKNPKTKRKAMAAPEVPEDGKNKHIFDEIYTALVNPGPDLVICDEGHRIKNSHASISTALKQLRTKRRVVLTGYPLQNNLTEYWCMVDFVRPNYLGSKTEFLNMFERPIMNGQCIDSTEADIKLMRYRAHVLHSLLVGFVQRRSHTVLQTVLPQKEEYVLLVRLTPFQRQLYDRFMNEVVRKQSVPNPLKAFAVCCKIWNHPDVLYNFLVKRAGGEAVDLDLEEVASTVSGVSTATDSKPKRGAKPRKTPAKGRNGKPAASVTPYSNSTEPFAGLSPMQPPPASTPSSNITSSNPIQTQSGNSASSFPSTIKTETNYGPYTDEFNQPRTTFEGISQFFDDHVSQSSYDENAQFSSFGPDAANFTPQSQANSSNAPDNFLQPTPATSTSLFNMDNQNTVTVSNSQTKTTPSPSVLPCLPSGISLTPIGARNQASNAGGRGADGMDVSSTDSKTQKSEFGAQNLPQATTSQNPGGLGQSYPPGFGLEFWETEKKPDVQPGPSNLNSSSNNSNTNPTTAWLKREETGQMSNLMNSLKNESSNESKPKINIISDIKLPPGSWPDKKINIISNIKIEPKKEEEDKQMVKRELEKIKNELKNELKIQDDVKPPAVTESPIAKLASLSPLKDSKEDSGIPYDWAIDLLKDYIPGIIENGAKFQILFCIIKESLALGDRLLVFSQSLITLDLIEQFLQSSEIPGDTQKWARNVSYYRLDGSTLAQEREKLINEFNSNAKIHLFLVSTRAGSLGINLIGANRVVVLDASWNPCHDTQAVCRVYRYGQRKPCFVYRLVVDNCLEKKIYDRQVSKQGMSDRVVDECNPDAHLTIKDVSTLCFDDKKDEGEIKDWSFCKDKYIDVVLQKVLEDHGTTLTKEPFQHESLLVDRKEKQLSQQEKRLAKKGYEREKNAARQPSYLSGSGRGHRPVASVRPMQQGGERPSRWIPAEHWQRQGMTAQEMTLPLDVVIPTNQPEKGNIVLKAGQKVLVLKSPKGVYMQLESGKIVAIKTAIKVKGKADDNSDPMKVLGKHAPPFMPPHMKVLPPMQGTPKRQPKPGPFMPGMTKMNVKSVQKTVPNLVSKIQSVTKRMQNQPDKSKSYEVGTEIARSLREGEPMPGSSSEDEHPLSGELARPTPPPSNPNEGADELEKKISQLKKNISIQRVTSGGVKQPLKPPQTVGQTSSTSQAAPPKPIHNQPPIKLPPGLLQDKSKSKQTDSILDRLGQSSSSMDTTPFQETLDSITAGFKNPDHLDQLDSDEEEEEDEDRPPIEDEEDLENEDKDAGLTDDSMGGMKHPMEMGDEADLNDSDEVTYVSEHPSGTMGNQFSNQQLGTIKSEPGDFTNPASGNYGYNYNYNVPPYQNHPPPQGYGYPPQPPPPFDGYSTYPHGQPPYNYGYQGYPPPQPHYPPAPPQTGYDYNNPAPVYPNYPYPQQYVPPPQVYPPPAQTAPPTTYTEYSQYPNQSQQSGSNYYQNN